MKAVFAFFVGALGLLSAAAVIWFYLAVRTLKEGGSNPPLVADRVAAILFSLALGTALACAASTYFMGRNQSKKPTNGNAEFAITIALPFIVTFACLFIAHSQLPSLQFTNDGEYVSPWGMLIICPLPVVAGVIISLFLEAQLGSPAPQDETEPPTT